MFKKLVFLNFVVFLTFFSSNYSYSIEPDVFVQSTVNRASDTLSKNNTKEQVVNQIMQETSALGGDTNRLLALSFLNATNEEIVKLKKQIEESKTTLSFWNKTTPNEQFTTDLENV